MVFILTLYSKTFRFDSSADLKAELEKVNPQILDSDFEVLTIQKNNVLFLVIMGLRETIQSERTAIRAAEAAASLAEKLRVQKTEEERLERYRSELPAMILAQRPLLMELKTIGVIALLEEMISPDKIEFPMTPEEASAEKALREQRIQAYLSNQNRGVIPVSEDRLSDFAKRMQDLNKQEYKAYVSDPKQLEDGSVDSTVHIKVSDNVAFRAMSDFYREGWIDLAYSMDRVLTINGEYTTFNEQIDPTNVDMGRIERSLARAFIYLKHEPLPKGPDHTHPTVRYI